MNKIQVVINDQKIELTTPLPLSDFLQQQGFLPSTLHKSDSLSDAVIQLENGHEKLGFAVALNQQVVPYQQWSSIILNDGDVIALFQAIAGG